MVMDNHNRKTILSELLERGEKGCTAYTLEKECGLGISISAISQHLKKLEEEGFICGEICSETIKEGRYKKIYRINENGKRMISNRIEEDIRLLVSKMPIEDRLSFLERVEKILNVRGNNGRK
ncbi:MAG: helix-turn-helix domain-containing protein [Candidatus Syntropharchaeia archaeon]